MDAATDVVRVVRRVGDKCINSFDKEGDANPSYDGQFYAERLASALGRITEVFDWDAKDLLTGNKQTTLFSF